MWWTKLLESLGRLVSDLVRTVDRFYVETRVGSARRWFLLTPLVWNNLDTDGSGYPDLRIQITPTVAVPPDGLTVTIERVGSGVVDLSATVFIGVDDGVYPVPVPPPAEMDFAFLGFEGGGGRIAPERLEIFFRQRAVGANTEVTVNLGARNAQTPLPVRAGVMTSPVASQQARGGVSGGPVKILAGDIALATELTDATLGLALPSGAPLTLDPPIHVTAVTAPARTNVNYSAPTVLSLDADATTGGQTLTRMRAHTSRMPASLSASIAAAEAVVHPAESLTADARIVGIALPLGFTSASAELTMPGLPLRVAWGPSPLLVDVGLQAGATGNLAVKVNARLLTGPTDIGSLELPPEPRQALVAEYIEQQELWGAINALGGLRLMMERTGTATSAAASLTLAEPVGEGSALVPPRSIRLSARTANRLMADIRASELAPDSPPSGPGTLTATAKLETGSADAKVSGRLRHVRALYDDGAARTEAWTVATPRILTLTYDNTDQLRFTFVPDAAMAVTADRAAVGAGGAVGGFARLFARLLLNAPLGGHYGLTPRQPPAQGTAASGSTATIHRDAAGTAFAPELVGMSLRYESGANQGQARSITAVGVGEIDTDPFESVPTAGDAFVIVSTDALVEATEKLARPSTRKGISVTVSAGRAREQRVATRIHPQVVQQTSRTWLPLVSSPGPDETDAIAARIEGVLSVTVPPPKSPGEGPLAADIELDAARPRRSVRYAQNRRWILPEAVREQLAAEAPFALRPVPRVRALLADAPDSINVNQAVDAMSNSYTVSRSGGGEQGWVWALTDQQRWDGAVAGIGVISLNITSLPQRLGVILATDLPDVRRLTPPGDVMWTPSAGWRAPSSQAITLRGDLRVERLVYATFWPGRTARTDGTAQSYPTRNEDEWDLTTATFAHLHDAGVANQRLTLWSLDGSDWDDPGRAGGIGIEAMGLNADLDLDRYRALEPPRVRHFATVRWMKQAEIQLQMYTGAWLLSGGLSPDYERPSEDTGSWFLRAIDQISGIGDAYFGNTSGNINGRTRLFP